MLRKIENLAKPSNQNDNDEPQLKRRRINDVLEESAEQSRPQLVFKKPGISCLPRKPLLTVNNPPVTAQPIKQIDEGVEGCYNVLWYENPFQCGFCLANVNTVQA